MRVPSLFSGIYRCVQEGRYQVPLCLLMKNSLSPLAMKPGPLSGLAPRSVFEREFERGGKKREREGKGDRSGDGNGGGGGRSQPSSSRSKTISTSFFALQKIAFP